MILLLPVNVRAARMAAMQASVPLPSMRKRLHRGHVRAISCASFSSYSWNRPVTGPHSRSSSITFSRTGA